MKWKSLLKCLIFKRKFNSYNFNGKDFNFDVEYAYNQWSPIVWLFCILLMPVYIFKGGLVEWVLDCKNLCSFDNSFSYELEGAFKDHVSKTRRKILLWSFTWSQS